MFLLFHAILSSIIQDITNELTILFTGDLMNIEFYDALTDSDISMSVSDGKFSQQASNQKPCNTLFFPGCSLLNDAPELVSKTYQFLHTRNMVDGITSLCCGKILLLNPNANKEEYQLLMDNFIQSIREHKVRKIITACANCMIQLNNIFKEHKLCDGVEVVSLTNVLHDMGVKISIEDDLAVFDSCVDRKPQAFGEPLRKILDAPKICEIQYTPDTGYCCGALQQARGDIEGMKIAAKARGEEGAQTGANVMLASCMSCSRILNFQQSSIEVRHYLEYLFDDKIDWSKANYHMSVCLFLNSDRKLVNVK